MPDVLAVLFGLGFTVATALSVSWMLCNPEHTRDLIVQGWRGLRDVCRPADAEEKP